MQKGKDSPKSWSLLELLRYISELTKQNGRGRRRQTLCDKRDNNFILKNFPPNFTLFLTDPIVKDQKALMGSKDHNETRK